MGHEHESCDSELGVSGAASRARDAVRKREERYRSFFENSSEGIWCSEYDPPISTSLSARRQAELIHSCAVIVECNDAFARLYQVDDRDQAIGRKLSEFFSMTPEWLSVAEHYASDGYRVTDRETREVLPDGGVLFFKNSAVGIVEDGMLLRTWGSQRDITEIKRLDEEKRLLGERLRQAQKMDAIGQLAGGVAHDFNNLLQAIAGYAEICQIEIPPGHPEIETSLREILYCTSRGASLTQKLLVFSRRDRLDRKTLDLAEIIRSMQPMLTRVLNTRIDLRVLLQDLRPICADRGQIEQVILNLCLNARDAMPHGGTLVVEASSSTLDAEFCALHADLEPGEYLRLSVSDSGCGIPEEYRDRVFEPFFSSKKHSTVYGSGLGLASIYGIVKMHGGSILFDTVVEQGTTFRVYLPADIS